MAAPEESRASGSDDGTEEGTEDGTGTEPTDHPLAASVERAFTCTACGYAQVHETGRLRVEVGSVCHNCGDWTTGTAAVEAVVDAAREAAEWLAGPVLTERQALGYLLRERVGLDRETAAVAMGSSASNVDNLHRRGREKVDAARELVAGLDALDPERGDGH